MTMGDDDGRWAMEGGRRRDVARHDVNAAACCTMWNVKAAMMPTQSALYRGHGRARDRTRPIPAEITAEGVARPPDLEPIERPAWLTLNGKGTESGNERFGESIEIDGQPFDSLDDVENPDQLGRAFGTSGYHASAHSDIDGVMGGFASPEDPLFYGLHDHIDAVVDEWLATPNGEAWAARTGEEPEDHEHHGA